MVQKPLDQSEWTILYFTEGFIQAVLLMSVFERDWVSECYIM